MTINRNRDSSAIDFEEDLSDVFLLDMEKIFSKVKRIFEVNFLRLILQNSVLQHPPPITPTQSPITANSQFIELLTAFLDTTKPKKSLMLFEDDDARLTFVQSYFIRSAKMLSKYEVFAGLPQNEKVSYP